MSVSVDLQRFIVNRLIGAAAVSAYCGDRVFDNAPSDPEFPYISIGDSEVLPDNAACVTGRREAMQIDVWSRQYGAREEARAICDAVRNALQQVNAEMTSGRIREIKIERSRVLRDPDGRTAHGLMQIVASIEEFDG